MVTSKNLAKNRPRQHQNPKTKPDNKFKKKKSKSGTNTQKFADLLHNVFFHTNPSKQ